MGSIARIQDLPPKGGYGPIQTERIKLKEFATAKRTLAALAVSTIIGGIGFAFSWWKHQREDIEMRSARYAIFPLILAERDRGIMKQSRENLLAEAELMKNVKGWETGTYYGEPIFFTVPKDLWVEPRFHEYFIHADPNIWYWREIRRLLL